MSSRPTGLWKLPCAISFVFDLEGAERIKHALVNLKKGSSNPLKNLLQSSDGS